MAWFLKYYDCSECGTKWTDEWSCTCNDRCPTCCGETEPYESQDLTHIVESRAGVFVVNFSPDTAEGSPDYRPIVTFANRADALAFFDRP